jgi:aspartyl protease family protein
MVSFRHIAGDETMFFRVAIIVGLISTSFVFMGNRTAILTSERNADTPRESSQQPVAAPPAQAISANGKYVIKANGAGQFHADFRLNGRTVNALVDTGATYVAINESTARKIGIAGTLLDYKYETITANGSTKAAHIILDRVEIGSMKVRDVEAFVLKDDSLAATLIGMSFLNKISSFSVKDGTLNLAN